MTFECWTEEKEFWRVRVVSKMFLSQSDIMFIVRIS